MFPKNDILKKRAWGGDDARYNYREDRYKEKQEEKKRLGIDPHSPYRGQKFLELHGQTQAQALWTALQNHVQTLKDRYKIKGVAFKEWLSKYGLAALRTSQDKAVRDATKEILTSIQDFAKAQMEKDPETAKAFKAEYGTNVQDWLGGAKVSKKKVTRLTSRLLRD